MNLLTLTEIRRAAQNGAASARAHVQVEKRDAQAHARTAAVLRAYVGRRMRPDDAARLERSSCVQNVQRVNQSGFHRAHRGVLPVAIRTRCPQVDGAAVNRPGKNELLQGPADLRAKQAPISNS
jgi:hypothetical protein